MENQKKPPLIRPSRTPRAIPNKNCCPKTFSTMGASTWFLSVPFYVCLQSLCKSSQTCQKKLGKSHTKQSKR